VHRMTFVAALAAGILAAGSASAQQGPTGQPATAKNPHWAAVHAACAADFKTFCAGQTGPANRRACIQQNRAKFSASCQGAMTQGHPGAGVQTSPAQ